MTILRDISIFWVMFHVLFLFIMLFRSRLSRKKTILAAGIGMGILMISNGAGFLICGFDVFSKIFLFTCSIPSFILFYVMSADKRFKFLFTFCLADTTCLWIMAVTNLLDWYFGGGKYVLMLISRLIAYPFVEYLAWRYLRKPYLELQETVEKGWGVFAGMTVLYYILLAVAMLFPTNIINRPEDTFLCILILLLMLANYATIFSALYRQLLLYRTQQNELVLQARVENQQRILKMKHDMKGYTVTLSGLLAAGKTKEAINYLKGMETNMDTLLGQFCANPYLNAVFVHYFGKLKELGAQCQTNIQIGEDGLPHMELCRILSNGLENVCDALKAVRKEERTASVQMKYNRDYLLIRIKNRCRDDMHVEKGTIPATDKEGHEHGFGLAAVQEAAQSLDGGMFCYTENGNFILDVMVACGSFQKEK